MASLIMTDATSHLKMRPPHQTYSKVLLILINTHFSVFQKTFFMFFKLKLVCLLLTKPLSDHSSWEAILDPLYILFGVKLEAWSQLGISTNCLEIGILYGADGGVTETRSDHNRAGVSGQFQVFRECIFWSRLVISQSVRLSRLYA